MEVVKAPDNIRDQIFIRMVEEYQKPLLDICYMYLRDRQMAEDAVQETFLKAYRGMGAFRGESGEKTWLTRIAINTCRDVRRSAWFTRVNRSVQIEDLPIIAREKADQDTDDLAEAIMGLPDKYKEVILLHYYQGLKMSEMAPIVGVSTSVVSRRIKKAHEALRAILGKEYLYG